MGQRVDKTLPESQIVGSNPNQRQNFSNLGTYENLWENATFDRVEKNKRDTSPLLRSTRKSKYQS